MSITWSALVLWTTAVGVILCGHDDFNGNNRTCSFDEGSELKDCGKLPRDCKNGVYTIYPKYSNGFPVYCEMTKYGGGWTVIQRREDGATNFLRDWEDYKDGFGSLMNEFWLGNENIHAITYSGQYQLLVELTDYEGNIALARYRSFMIGPESTKYKLSVTMYSGNAGDSLTYHNGMAFSTKDKDNDLATDNCAKAHSGAWWFNSCLYSNLNGEYFYTKNPRGDWNGIHWYHWKGKTYSLKRAVMMVRAL